MNENPSVPTIDTAKQALDRAHTAALQANGAELRRSLQEARDCLADSNPDCAAKLDTALADLGSGALAELDQLLESVRRDLAA